MPWAAAPARTGIPRDLSMVKVKTSEGLVVRLLMVGIVRIVVMLLSKSTGVFYKAAIARGPPSLGSCWAITTRARPHLSWAARLPGQNGLLPALFFF